MANNYCALYYHFVFSTKARERFLLEEHWPEIWTYIAGIAKKNNMLPIAIGGVEDHIHILASIPPTISVSEALRILKGGSSYWIYRRWSERYAGFEWQGQYGALTVSQSAVSIVKKYIENQKANHASKSFEEEWKEIENIATQSFSYSPISNSN